MRYVPIIILCSIILSRNCLKHAMFRIDKKNVNECVIFKSFFFGYKTLQLGKYM